MTVRERVLMSKLIQKIENNESYAKQIGLSYSVDACGEQKNSCEQIQEKENK